MRGLAKGWIVLVGIWLVGCQVVQTGPSYDVSSARQIEKELEDSLEARGDDHSAQTPESISDALLPPLTVGSELSDPLAERFDISVEALPAKDFFIGLVKDTAYNMAVHPNVMGEISLELKNVTVDEVMKIVRDVYGFDYVKSGRLYRVLPTDLRTQMFKIDYLNVQRFGSSETQVSAGQVTNADTAQSSGENDLDAGNQSDTGGTTSVIGTRVRTQTSADFWSSLASTLTMIIGPGEGHKVVVSPQAGLAVVRAYPKQLHAVQEFLDKAELSLRRQVILEAKILEVQLNDGFQAGINWTAINKVSDGKNVIYGTGLTQGPRLVSPDGTTTLSSTLLNLPGGGDTEQLGADIGGAFSAALNLKDFNGLIDLLATQGTVQVLSSPRVSTVNNQKAVIKVGTDEFFVTEVSSQTTTTTTSSTPTVDVELTPFFSGIALDVTPQISESGEIILHVHPTVSEVVDQAKTVASPTGQLTLPLALSTIRESDSIVRARSGQVVVIGGLMQNTAIDDTAKTPGVGNVPLFGHLFRQKQQRSGKSELVILLKPIIADDAAWRNAIQNSKDNMTELRQALQPGWFK